MKPRNRYSAASGQRRKLLLPLLVVLLVGAAGMQHVIDPTAKKYHVGSDNDTKVMGGLNNEFLLLPLLGFREAAAGLLWVRCDEFFHSGDYDAILPLVRMITWLDPHAENVFVTGAWHLSYNFTDSSERSDRRYIAPSEALLDEGIRKNMNIPDIKFEKGWENFDKIKDFIAAERAFKMAIDTPPHPGGDDWPYGAPLKTLHVLAHTYEKQGRIPEALDEWNQAIARSTAMLKAKPLDYSTLQLQRSEQHDYAELLQRYRDRYTKSGHDAVNPSQYPAVLMPAQGESQPRPWDVSFKTEIAVSRPKDLKISGQFNSADGARIDVRITDWSLKERPIANAVNSFDIDWNQTILMDQLSVRQQKFGREIDMSKDPKMYGFNDSYYRIVLSYNPRTSSPHLLDRFGWSGEGMTDKAPGNVFEDQNPLLVGTKLIDGQGGTGPVWDGVTVPWTQHGQTPRLIRVVYKVSRDQIMNKAPITDKDIVSNSMTAP